MIIAAPRDRPEFTPGGQEEGARRTYVFRVPLLLDRARLERDTLAAGGRRAGIFETIAEARNAVVSLMAEDDPDRAAAIEMIDAYRKRILEAADEVRAARGDTREEALRAWSEATADRAMNDLSVELRKHWAPLREIEGDALVYPLIRGTIAARQFLVGWRGVEDKLQVDSRGVKDASLVKIPDAHLVAIAGFVETLFAPTEVEKKTSASSPGGDCAPPTSTAGSSSP